MQRQDVIRAVFFVIFFGIGAAAFGAAILSDELIRHYQNKKLLAAAQERLENLKTLNADYDVLLERLRGDHELLKRIAPIVLGTEAPDANAVYPAVSPEQLEAVRKALKAASETKEATALPRWLQRASEPRKRFMLLAAGAFLILISFGCFGRAKQDPCGGAARTEED